MGRHDLLWFRCRLAVAAAVVALAAAGCGERRARPSIAFVTNGVASFWTIAKAGALAGGKAFDCDVDVRMPSSAQAQEQNRIVEGLLARGVQGIAISPIDGTGQAAFLNEACRRTKLITQDSDAPATQRLCYVGMSNYDAGRMCGKLVKEAMPAGGSVMIFVGRLEQDNARGRRQGVIDELLGRSHDPRRYDPPGKVVAAAGYTVVDTRTDHFDRSRAKANAEDAIALHPDLGCMVGLFAYNPPACIEACREAGKLGRIQIVGFDEHAATLRGILDGVVHGTVVQDPYRYGFESVRILAGLARGDESVLPPQGFLDVPARYVRRDNCRVFREDLARKMAAAR